MKADGKAVIIITHKLHEVLSISDRVAILRKGAYVGDIATRDADEAKLTEMMVGEKVELNIDRPEPVDLVKRLDIQHLTVHSAEGITVLDDASFRSTAVKFWALRAFPATARRSCWKPSRACSPPRAVVRASSTTPRGQRTGAAHRKSPKAIREAGIHLSFVPEGPPGYGPGRLNGQTDNMMLKATARGHSPIVDRTAFRTTWPKPSKELGVVRPI